MAFVIKVLKTPLFILSVLTQAKSFKDNPVIGSRLLNRLGLHIKRVVLARLSTGLRWMILAPLMPRALRREYHKNGFVIVEDFLAPREVSAIRADISAHTGDTRQMTQGDTATQRFLLDDATLAAAPHLHAIARNQKLRRYLHYTGAKIAAPLLYVQRIRNGRQSGVTDPQKNMHSDTFHPTMKAWLFLEDVSEAKGPFTYVAGSNRLTFKRLVWEYKQSVGAAAMKDKYSEKGSFRATAEDLAFMDLPGPKGITAKAGTLVIANTNGFHGRGQAESGASRLELWAYSRHNPFNPFPGLPVPFAGKIKHAALHLFWRRADQKAAARNSKASWHLIEPHEMLGDLTHPQQDKSA